MTSAEEAVARAKAIAARLAGTGASAAVDPEPVDVASFSSAASNDAIHANAVADAALAAAFGQVSDQTTSGSKRKRWGDESTGKTDNVFCLIHIFKTKGIKSFCLVGKYSI